eukprot:CAMPEP_0180823758 /NCGR_PEP_ID=MMETSP1038_2-20121128/72075_1 /TAXON_ID=632150 /ORGANISM="Azadinium spinosum, Strain 3D9" /LENGTH=77 /DNA_ID=CAMNT_0022866109 /DNA_START=30 /DNA_END=260 /DNA_ORIENTATION=-
MIENAAILRMDVQAQILVDGVGPGVIGERPTDEGGNHEWCLGPQTTLVEKCALSMVIGGEEHQEAEFVLKACIALLG